MKPSLLMGVVKLLMSFGNIFRVVCHVSMPNAVQATLNKYLAAVTDGSDSDFTTLMGQCATYFDSMSALVDVQTKTTCTWDSISLYKVDDSTAQEVLFGTQSLTPTPANTNSLLPGTVSALIAAGVVNGRGILKLHLPGFAANTLESTGLFGATALTAMGLAAAQLQGGLQLTSPLTAAVISWNPVAKSTKSVGSASYTINIPSHVDRRQVGVGT